MFSVQRVCRLWLCSVGCGRGLPLNSYKVPINAYDLFEQLKNLNLIDDETLQEWKKVVGLRNTIVHEYMKINIMLVKAIVKEEKYGFVLDFLNTPFVQLLAGKA